MQKKGVPATGTPAGEQGIATLKESDEAVLPPSDCRNRTAFPSENAGAMGGR
ncbi:MAG: hypothetical protein QOC89_54 [Paraburkholderia sp.]|nr:hypothetical protein [Paraburkholderia sp.]